MPIPFLAAAAAASVSYVRPVLISAFVGLVGGYTLKSSKKIEESAEELLKLRQESARRQGERDQAVENLATTTNNHIHDLVLNTERQRQQILRATDALEGEVRATDSAKQQLQGIAALISQVTQTLGQDAQPLVFELQNRLDALILTHADINAARDELVVTVGYLQATVQAHVDVQQRLEADAGVDKKTIRTLIIQLEEAVEKLGNLDDGVNHEDTQLLRADKENLLAQVNELQAQRDIYSSQLKKAGLKITELRAQNATLQNSLSAVSAKPASDTGEQSDKGASYKPSMF